MLGLKIKPNSSGLVKTVVTHRLDRSLSFYELEAILWALERDAGTWLMGYLRNLGPEVLEAMINRGREHLRLDPDWKPTRERSPIKRE